VSMRGLLALALLMLASPAAPAAAQSAFTQGELDALQFHQHPGAALPLDAPLIDEDGRAVRLGDFLGRRPVILVLDYLHCRTLCGFSLVNLVGALERVPLAPGRDYQVLALSIDPREGPPDAAAARAKYVASASSATGWHFLTAAAPAIREIADTVGFPYRYDAGAQQFAHPAGITILSPGGRISRYLLGIDYRPLDLRLGLTEAAGGAISSPAASLLLLCYCYDPATGRYSAEISTAMRVLGGLTVAGIAILLLRLARARHG